jgi:uncharacterized protein YlxW (UPF0749 family)
MFCICGIIIMIMLMLTLNLINKTLDPESVKESVTKAAYELMLNQVRDLEITAESLAYEVRAKQNVWDSSRLLDDREIQGRMDQLHAEIALLEKDVEKSQEEGKSLDREKEKLRELVVAIQTVQHLKKFSSSKVAFDVIVFQDSYDSFHLLRKILVQNHYEYTLFLIPPGEVIVDRGGTSQPVQ